MLHESQKVVFLDIDGVVLDRASYSNRRQTFILSGGDISVPIAPSSCVDALNHITDQTGALIVVSSVWRHMGRSKIRDLLREWGVTGKVLDITPELRGQERGEEIQKWIDKYQECRAPVGPFVILDDDSDMAHLMPRLVQTNFQHGLTMDHAKQAINMLR